MAQRASEPENALAEIDQAGTTDPQWEEMLRESASQVIDMTDEEAWESFDRRAREVVGIGGEEFIRWFEAHEFDNVPDDWNHIEFWPLTM